MLYAISSEDLNAIVIHPDGNAHHERPLRLLEPLTQIVIQMHCFRRLVKLGDGQSKGRIVEFFHVALNLLPERM
jgi:hypothetical protein